MSGMDYSSFLSNGSSSAGTMNFGVNLADYASIRNGSYGKLMKATYAQQKKEEKASEAKDTKQDLTALKSAGDALKSSAEALTDRKLWEKKTIKTKDKETGETVEKEDYDREAINSAIKKFVEDYNAMIDKASESDTKGVLRGATRMIDSTETVSKLLGQVGIKIGADNKLSIDDEKFSEASIGTLKTLFEGSGSYADQISQKASAVSRSAKQATDTYTSEGKYTNSAAGVLTSGKTSGTSSTGKATYQISDDMKNAILAQVKLDFYMYGGDASGKADSNAFKKEMDKYLNSLESKNRSAASDTIKKFREELTDQAAKAIKAENPNWKLGQTVDSTLLNKVFSDDELLKKAEAQVYSNSLNVGV